MINNKGQFVKGHNLGTKMSIELRKKISRGRKGMKFSIKHRKNLSIAKKGKPSNRKGKHLSLKIREKMSKSKMGIKLPPFTEEHKRKISESHKREKHPLWGRRGDKSIRWKGGVTPINHIIRNSFEYKLWRESVFKRDNWTCRFCGQYGGYLEADHIKPFALFPELRFAIDNGRTLCKECHKKTDTFGCKCLKNKNLYAR